METHEKSAGETEASMAYASAMREQGTGRNTKYTINHQEHEERRASERREPEQPRLHGVTRQQGSNMEQREAAHLKNKTKLSHIPSQFT